MLTIGEFSRLGRVSPRMLRYYDALGLLCPEQVGENGYRDYQQAQLETLLRIRRFQDYGFPLAQVGELLDSSEELLLQRLHRRRLDAHYEIYRLQERLRELEAENRALRKRIEEKDEVIDVLKKSVGILSKP